MKRRLNNTEQKYELVINYYGDCSRYLNWENKNLLEFLRQFDGQKIEIQLIPLNDGK